jgi:hypothetical protein
MKLALIALLLVGCGARVSMGDNGSGENGLGGTPETDTGSAGGLAGSPTDSGTSTTDSRPYWLDVDVGERPPAMDVGAPITASDVLDVIVEEPMRRIRVESSCRVTDHTGLDAMAGATHCSQLFAVIGDTTIWGCGPNGGNGTVTVHLRDGRTFVRDLSADRCSVVIPSLPTHKHVYAAWYSAGGK